VDRFTAVDDFGTIINPMIVEGQVHGGMVQGIGQALLENCVYDKETGQLLTGSYMDYAMPRADDFPEFKLGSPARPCTHNPLGTKGCGEAGAIGSPAGGDQCGARCAQGSGREGLRHARLAQPRVGSHPGRQIRRRHTMYAFTFERPASTADAAKLAAQPVARCWPAGRPCWLP
jgi:hypothetical protein